MKSASLIPSWYTPPEVATALRVDSAKVRTWILSGALPAVNLASAGRSRPRWRVSPTDLEAFLEARRHKPRAKPIRRRRKGAIAIKEFV